ncbi:MAG: GTPase domain-containing protein [Lachnospiraceae bacterium]|nr:GTPase domain-containing protein [Lachnospiraceae bacterium]
MGTDKYTMIKIESEALDLQFKKTKELLRLYKMAEKHPKQAQKYIEKKNKLEEQFIVDKLDGFDKKKKRALYEKAKEDYESHIRLFLYPSEPRKDGAFQTNLLVIGETGAGKSSLINYLYDTDADAGAGRPKTGTTGQVLSKYEIRVEGDFLVNVYDTWGLEADKTKNWEASVLEELKQSDVKRINDWFHTIIVCINAAKPRTEEYMTELVKNLLEDGNRVIIALTHFHNAESSCESISKRFVQMGVRPDAIIRTCPVEGGTLLSGVKLHKSGKEELKAAINQNLCEMIVNKTVSNYKKILDEKENVVRQRKNLVIDERFNLVNYRSEHIGDKNYSEERDIYEAAEKGLVQVLKNMYNDAWQYYFGLMKKYNVAPLVEENQIRKQLKRDFSRPERKPMLKKLTTSYEDEKWELKIFYDKQIEELFQRLGTFAEDMFGKIMEV